jgi:ribose 5-phosphate isomerase B
MNMIIGSDHAGFELKGIVKSFLEELGHTIQDVGAHSTDRVNYPDIAFEVGKLVVSKSDQFGILICGSGIGMSMAANKVQGVRAAMCSGPYSAKLSRQHNNSNILCLGARLIGVDMAKEIVNSWCNSQFEGGRHGDRVALMDNFKS